MTYLTKSRDTGYHLTIQTWTQRRNNWAEFRQENGHYPLNFHFLSCTGMVYTKFLTQPGG